MDEIDDLIRTMDDEEVTQFFIGAFSGAVQCNMDAVRHAFNLRSQPLLNLFAERGPTGPHRDLWKELDPVGFNLARAARLRARFLLPSESVAPMAAPTPLAPRVASPPPSTVAEPIAPMRALRDEAIAAAPEPVATAALVPPVPSALAPALDKGHDGGRGNDTGSSQLDRSAAPALSIKAVTRDAHGRFSKTAKSSRKRPSAAPPRASVAPVAAAGQANQAPATRSRSGDSKSPGRGVKAAIAAAVTSATDSEDTFMCYGCGTAMPLGNLPPGVAKVDFRCADCVVRNGEDGHDWFCAVCGLGGNVVMCDGEIAPGVPCPRSGHGWCFGINNEEEEAKWFCHICDRRAAELVIVTVDGVDWPVFKTRYTNAKGEHHSYTFDDGKVIVCSQFKPYEEPSSPALRAQLAWVRAREFYYDRHKIPVDENGRISFMATKEYQKLYTEANDGAPGANPDSDSESGISEKRFSAPPRGLPRERPALEPRVPRHRKRKMVTESGDEEDTTSQRSSKRTRREGERAGSPSEPSSAEGNVVGMGIEQHPDQTPLEGMSEDRFQLFQIGVDSAFSRNAQEQSLDNVLSALTSFTKAEIDGGLDRMINEDMIFIAGSIVYR